MQYLKYIIFIVLFGANSVNAANNPVDEAPSDTIALEEISITANRLVNFSTGTKVQKIKSEDIQSYTSSNLSELLFELTNLSVKSYGVSGLSNISLRGMSSKHTAVLWNGINLQNTMNGGTDMNSMPSFLIDEISIQHGGASALFGSGAIGGVIHISNTPKFENKLNIQYNQSVGSFSNFNEGLKIDISNHKIASSTRIYHNYAKNDFEFVNTQQFGKPTISQNNAATKQYGILQSNSLRIKKRQQVTVNFWTQHHYLEVPPMMTNTISEQNQNTDNIRASIAWNLNGEMSTWFARAFYNYQSQVYKDPLLNNLISELDNYSVIGEIENKISLGDHILINTGLNNTYDKAITNNYSEDKIRNRTALFSSLKYFNSAKTFAIVLSLRDELVDNELSPYTFSLSSKYWINNILGIHGSASKNYNLPTFNDLYWATGGNPNLKAENGWNEDFGIIFNPNFKNHQIKVEVSAFNINLNNHVIWIPTTSSYWTAENVENLWSRGIESNFNYEFKHKNISVKSNIIYAFTKSTYEESDNTEASSIGKQLMYIPKHKGTALLKLRYKWINISYIHNFVDKRYITKDNSGYVDGYQVADASIGGVIKLKSADFNVNFKINNIWNETYEVMAFYAMPLRYYSISLSYNFNKQIN